MDLARWTAVDDWIEAELVGSVPAVAAARERSVRAGLPPHEVAPNQGALLRLLVRATGARSVLEIGTLGGCSTIWLAGGLPPGGRVVTLEVDPVAAVVATENLRGAGVADVVEVRVGPALDTLPVLEAEGAGPFDVVFVDADKRHAVDYVQWGLRLSRPGTLIVVDNVVRGGAVLDDGSDDPSVQGVRALFDFLGQEPGLAATALQTVGAKGHDGFLLAVVQERA